MTLLRGVVQAAEELAKEGISAEVRGSDAVSGCGFFIRRPRVSEIRSMSQPAAAIPLPSGVWITYHYL